MHLWEEATRTIVCVYNSLIHLVLDNKNLEEDFSLEKQEFIHLRIFGFVAYIHIPKEKRTKINPSGRKGIFVGYINTPKAHYNKN